MKLHGGGGTSHIPLFEYIEKKRVSWDMDSTIVVSFTDGYSDFPEKRPLVDNTIFILSTNHCPIEDIPKWGQVVSLQQWRFILASEYQRLVQVFELPSAKAEGFFLH